MHKYIRLNIPIVQSLSSVSTGKTESSGCGISSDSDGGTSCESSSGTSCEFGSGKSCDSPTSPPASCMGYCCSMSASSKVLPRSIFPSRPYGFALGVSGNSVDGCGCIITIRMSSVSNSYYVSSCRHTG